MGCYINGKRTIKSIISHGMLYKWKEDYKIDNIQWDIIEMKTKRLYCKFREQIL
jgi:hypothetical protein